MVPKRLALSLASRLLPVSVECLNAMKIYGDCSGGTGGKGDVWAAQSVQIQSRRPSIGPTERIANPSATAWEQHDDEEEER